METGFGSPSLTNLNASAGSAITTALAVHDWGFGSPSGGVVSSSGSLAATSWPSDELYLDTAFGSPFMVFEETPYLLDALGGFPTEGGVIAKLFTNLDVQFAPYYIRFYQTVSGVRQHYPNSSHQAYSCVAGDGAKLYPRNGNTNLRFAVPPLSKGIYSLEIRYGVNQSLELDVVDAIRVVPSPRDAETYTIRRRFSNVMKVGARNKKIGAVEFGGAEKTFNSTTPEG